MDASRQKGATMARKRKPMSERKHRLAMRPTFNGRSNPVVGVSDAVLAATTANVRAARLAEREWKRTLSKGQRRKLRAA